MLRRINDVNLTFPQKIAYYKIAQKAPILISYKGYQFPTNVKILEFHTF
jgi:hypothetical protein